MADPVRDRIEYLMSLQKWTLETISELYGLISGSTSDDKNALLTEIREAFESPPGDSGETSYVRARLRGLFSAEKLLESSDPARYVLDLDTVATPTISLNKASRVQVSELCAGIREIIEADESVSDPHRVRILRRLSALEIELHKPRGLLHLAIGIIDELSQAAGRAGKNAKPIADRLREIRGITDESISKGDALPRPPEQKRLPPPDQET